MEKSTIQGLQQPTNKPTYEKRAPIALLRDQLELTTWVTLGAITQGLLFLVVGRIALLPAIAYILFKVGDAYAVRTGLKHNHYLDDVIATKHAVVFPDKDGNYNKPGQDEVCVFHIGARVNSYVDLILTATIH